MASQNEGEKCWERQDRVGWGGVGVDVFTRIVCINPLVEQSIGDGPLHKKKGDEI